MEFDVAPCELVTGDGPLLAFESAYDPVSVRGDGGALQGVDGLARARRPCLNPSLTAPAPVVRLLVGGPEDVVAHRPNLSVCLDRPVAGVGAHGVSRVRRPCPRCVVPFGGH